MFQLSLTTYGQSLVSSSIQIDGIALTASYTSTISSLENVSSLTTVFDDDSVGNYNSSILNIRIRDLSSAAYQAKTIVFYKLVNSVKKIVAAYSSNSAIVNKTASSEVNLFLSFDASCFTHGFTLSSIQASPSSASLNNDGIVHIDDESTSADDSYSVYSKPQVDTLLENKQDSLSAGDGIAITNDVVRTTGIPFGICDNTSTATAFTVTVPGIYKLEDGVCCLVKNGVITSAAGFTLDVNGLGGKPVYSNMAAATAESTIFNINYTLLFVYDSTRVSGGCWICYRGYYSDKNDNSIGYQLRGNVHTLPTTAKFYRYRLLFTSADGTHFVPSNTSTSTNATSKRDVVQTPIDPFGEIVYYSTTTAIEANANPGPTYLWTQYAVTLGYSFNRTGATLVLDSFKPLYIKCAPQSNGSAIIDADNPYVQTLPNTADGKIYIFLGITSSATTVELLNNHPVYYHDGTSIKVWVGKDSYSKTEADTLLASYVPTSRKVNNKALTSDITLNLDDVADGSTRKLSDYVPATRTVNSKALSSNITLTASDVGALPSSTTIPTVNDKTITIKKTSSDTGDTFTLNQSTDKTIILGLAAVATSGSYSDLSNKPTIPTVNNASLTINKGGTNDTTSKTFTANASSNVTINLGLGEAADKSVDSSISAASTSTKLPTSQAVASFVEGKGYITQHQSLSDLVATAQYNSTTGKIEFYNKSNTKLSTDIDATPFTKDGMLDSVSVVLRETGDYGGTKGVVLVSYESSSKMTVIKVVREVLNVGLSEGKQLVEQELPAYIYTGLDSSNVYAAILASSSYDSSKMTFYYNVGFIKYLRFHFNSDANKSDIDIPLEDLSQVLEDKLKTVAFTGSYNDLTNKPSIPSVDYAYNKASSVIAGTGNIYGYQLVFRVEDNLYESICTSCTTDTTKTKNPHGFYLDKILYYSYSLTKNSGEIALSTYLYTSYPLINGQYSFNCLSNSLTNNQAIYLVVTFNSTDRKFYLDDTWWTQTLPSTEDNKFYVYLGMVAGTSNSIISLETDHPIFFFKNGKIRQTSAEIIDTVADMYVPTTRTVNSKTLSSNITLTLDDVSDGTSRAIPTNTNQLTNGAGFITSSSSITGNAAGLSKTNSNNTYTFSLNTTSNKWESNIGFVFPRGQTCKIGDLHFYSNDDQNDPYQEITTDDGPLNVIDMNGDTQLVVDSNGCHVDVLNLCYGLSNYSETATSTIEVKSTVTDNVTSYYTELSSNYPISVKVAQNSASVYLDDYIYVNTSIVPKTGSSVNVGTYEKPVTDVYSAYLDLCTIVNGDTYNYYFGIDTQSDCAYFSGNLNPEEDDALSLGSSTKKWYNVHSSYFTGDLDGKLKTPRKINGISFDGSAEVNFCGTCETAAATAAKTVTIAGYTALQVGSIINVLFNNTNEASNPTLQVNDLDALPIYCGNSAAGTTSATSWFGSEIVTLTYSRLGGGRWYMIGKLMTPPGYDTSGINLYTGYPAQICAARSNGVKIATGWPSGTFSGTTIPLMLGAYANNNITPVWFCGISGVVASTLAGAGAVGHGTAYNSVTRTTSASGVRAGGVGAIRTLIWLRTGTQSAVLPGTVIADGQLNYNSAMTVSATSGRLTLADDNATVTVSAGTWVTLSFVPEQTTSTVYFITAVRVA
jgi:hypothetical protein